MDTIKNFLDDLGLSLTLLIAGAFGGLISITKDENVGVWGRLNAVVTGAVSANYIAPIVFELVDFPKGFQLGFAYVVGLMGFKANLMVISYVQRKIKNKD